LSRKKPSKCPFEELYMASPPRAKTDRHYIEPPIDSIQAKARKVKEGKLFELSLLSAIHTRLGPKPLPFPPALYLHKNQHISIGADQVNLPGLAAPVSLDNPVASLAKEPRRHLLSASSKLGPLLSRNLASPFPKHRGLHLLDVTTSRGRLGLQTRC
jgi:hypothetical protein